MGISENLKLIADGSDRESDKFDRVAFAKKCCIKSDYVGWMSLDIKKDADKLKFRQISSLAKNSGLKLRGTYTKKAAEPDAEWYRFSPQNDFAISDFSYSQEHGEYWYSKIKAYKAPKGCNIMGMYVSQAFVDCYRELNLTGLDFIWVPDNGKYQAVSFYNPIFMERAKRCIFPGVMSYLKKETYDTVTKKPLIDNYDFSAVNKYYKQADFPTGNLCEIEKYMDNLDVVLPLAVEYASMPDTDFAYCYLNGFIPIYLIRDTALQKMLNAGVVTKNDFEPVMCINPKEQELLVRECDEYEDMSIRLENKEYFEKMRLQLMAKERPEFIPSEKEVLALLKKYKKKYPEYMNRAISKGLAEEVGRSSSYFPLLPYYKVACGGRLAEDTYEYFNYETAKEKNDIWHRELTENAGLRTPEYDKKLDEAVLFGRSGDDNYLVLDKERVYEVSCYDYSIIKRWNQVYLFFYENVTG